MNLNKAFIIGRLTRDPELRTTPTGQAVARFGLATNRVVPVAGGGNEERVEYHNIVAWGRLAEICSQYLAKGRLVFIEGRIQTRSWQGKDGVKRTSTEIIAENMQMGPRPAAQAPSEGGPMEKPAAQAEEEIPTVGSEELPEEGELPF